MTNTEDPTTAAANVGRADEQTPLLGTSSTAVNNNGVYSEGAQGRGEHPESESMELSNRRLAAVFGSVWVSSLTQAHASFRCPILES
jgi:hypothetical protein